MPKSPTMPLTGRLLVKAELSYLLCFVTLEPAWAWDGVAARTNGLVGDRRGTSWELSKLRAPVEGSWKLPGPTTNAAELERSQGWDVWLFGLARGAAVAGHPGPLPIWLLQ